MVALVPVLLEGIPELAPLIEKLQHENVMGARNTLALQEAQKVYQAADSPGFGEFDTAASRYIESSRKHLVTEETALLPVAR